jgi:CRISPR-associated protein (TIGR03986 family)
MIPQHKDPKISRRAIAPYNFVPLPDEIRTISEALPRFDRYDPNLLTGKLHCRLTTASPVYVRAAQTLEEYSKELKPADPYYGETREELLIPGSSLRGMLRNMVEIISQSAIKPVTDKSLFFRTLEKSSIGNEYGERMTGGDPNDQGWFPLAEAGYMELRQGDYFIRPAREIMGTQHYRVSEEAALKAITRLKSMAYQKQGGKWAPNKYYEWLRVKIWFIPAAPQSHLPESPTYYADVEKIMVCEKQPGPGWEQGSFIASGWVPSRKGGKGKKRHWIVGPPLEDDTHLIRIDDEDIDLYKEYGGGISQAIKKANFSVLPESPNQLIPCFYIIWTDEKNKQRVAFGHTAMFRLPYTRSPADMIPGKIKSVDGINMTESIFGDVGTSPNQSDIIAGRVSVGDAHHDGNAADAIMKDIVISTQALSSPKPTTFQHYLTQNSPEDPDWLTHYGDDPDKETTLRGHKLYWHAGDEQQVETRLKNAMKPRLRQDGTEDPEDRNEFKPVRSGQTFNFDIHFENLRPEELGALLWVLDKASQPKYRLKIGMGKPYGLGSVAITYEPRLTDRQARYTSLFKDKWWNEGWLEEAEAAAKVDEAQLIFVQWLLKDENATLEGVDNLPRTRQLLALLTWEGKPDSDETRYMILDQFTGRQSVHPDQPRTKRPVLPYPTTVLGGTWNKDSYYTPTETPAPPRERRAAQPKPELVAKAPGELQPGDIIRAKVHDAPGVGDITLIPEVAGEEDMAIIRAENRAVQRYWEGREVKLEVIELGGDAENGWLVDCRPVI